MIHFVLPNWQPFEEMGPEGRIYWIRAILNVMLKTGVSLGLPTLLMGMAFPVVTRVTVSLRRGVGKDVGRLYACNTMGAIIGSAGAGFVLIPALGVTATLALLAAIQVTMGATLLLAHPTLTKQTKTALAVGAAVGLVIMVGRILASGVNIPLQQLPWNETLVYYEEGPLATVSIAEDQKGYRTIYVDNVGVAGTDRVLLTDQKSLAHVPMLLTADPKSALTVGFGSGGASFSYSTYDRLEAIHCVEICSTVLRPAPLLTASNHGILMPHGVLHLADGEKIDFVKIEAYGEREMAYEPVAGFRTFDPRYRILLDDARSYLHFTKTEYDIIATDCTDLRYKSNANLYDLGYFQLCRERIRPGGMVVVWMPLGGLSDEAFRCALRTFHVVFPHMTVWYFGNEPTHYILLIGTEEPQEYDYSQIVERLKEKDVGEDLAELYLDNPEKILSCYVTDESGMERLLGEGPLNTENTPFLEFESPKYGYGSVPLRRNMEKLFDVMTPVTDRVVDAPSGALDQIRRLQEAAPTVFRGHDRYREYHFREACAAYLEALKKGGPDAATEALLNFDELAATVRTLDPENLRTQWLAFHLASVYAMQERWSDAVTALGHIPKDTGQLQALVKRAGQPGGLASLSKEEEERVNLNGRVQALMAYCYAAAGSPESARQHVKRAADLLPGNEDIQQLATAIQEGKPLPERLP
jgi:spermidine synthase